MCPRQLNIFIALEFLRHFFPRSPVFRGSWGEFALIFVRRLPPNANSNSTNFPLPLFFALFLSREQVFVMRRHRNSLQQQFSPEIEASLNFTRTHGVVSSTTLLLNRKVLGVNFSIWMQIICWTERVFARCIGDANTQTHARRICIAFSLGENYLSAHAIDFSPLSTVSSTN